MDWHLLPHADSELKSKASLLQGRFIGDPSFDYEHNVTHRVGDGDSADQKTTVVSSREASAHRWATQFIWPVDFSCGFSS